MRKKLVTVVLMAVLSLNFIVPASAAAPAASNNRASNGIAIMFNDQQLDCDQPPVIINGRTLVPLRVIFEALGANVSWENGVIVSSKGNDTIVMTIGSKQVYKNGDIYESEVAPQIINSRTMVPVRIVAESFNCQVEWYGDADVVYIMESTYSTDAWKEAYIDYINDKLNYWATNYGSQSTQRYHYKLVDVNGDAIPELYSGFGCTAQGDTLCTYSNGHVVEQWMWIGGFRYVEGQNIFSSTGGNMGYYYNEIRSIQDEAMPLVDYFTYEMLAGGYPTQNYQYYWNDMPISEADYHNRLSQYFDEDQLLSPYDNTVFDPDTGRYVGNGLCDVQEIVQAIITY